MATVVTIKCQNTNEITYRKVFQYPATARACADSLEDTAERMRLDGEGEFLVTCEEDSYSTVEDNDLSLAASLKIRLDRLADDRKEARKIRERR